MDKSACAEPLDGDALHLTGSFAIDESTWEEFDGDFAQWLLDSREHDGISTEPVAGNLADSSDAACSNDGITPQQQKTGSTGSASKKRPRSSDTCEAAHDTAVEKLERLRCRNRLAQARRRQRQRVLLLRTTPKPRGVGLARVLGV